MALDLQPLTDETIESMGLSPSDLWVVKFHDEVFGPFELEALKSYALENEKVFEHAHACLMNTEDWKLFFSIEHFSPVKAEVTEESLEHFWLLDQGRKTGPLTRQNIDKKFEMGLLNLTDMVSVDDGHTWNKFFQVEGFGAASEVLSPPAAPLESSFQRAKEELNERMDHQERTGSHAALASLVYFNQKKEKAGLNLEEIDIKSLDETEVSRSLKWAIPSAVAGAAVLLSLGNYIMTPGAENELAETQEASKVIMPKSETTASVPTGRSARRKPSSVMPHRDERSALTNVPPMHRESYPPAHVETHYNEPDPMMDPPMEAEQPPAEHSLVNNSLPANQGESLDQSMAGNLDQPEMPPESPVIEESSDF